MSYIHLEGGCFVVDPANLEPGRNKNWLETAVITRQTGASDITQYRIDIEAGKSPIRRYPGSDCILFVVSGQGSIDIGGRIFPLQPDTGVYVRAGECFSFENSGNEPLEMIANVCPECEKLQWPDVMTDEFDSRFPERTAKLDESQRETTGDRFYQLLIGPEHGSDKVTQFVGAIPRSRAPAHFHVYEEVITVLRGEGIMWAGKTSAPIRRGSMIYLPKKQPHCVECTVPSGIELLGLFYPAGSPAIRY